MMERVMALLHRNSLRRCYFGLYFLSLIFIGVCNALLIPYGTYNIFAQVISFFMVASLVVHASQSRALALKLCYLLCWVVVLNIVAGLLPMYFEVLRNYWTLWAVGLPDRLLLLWVLFLLLKQSAALLRPVVVWMMAVILYKTFGVALLVGGAAFLGFSNDMAMLVNAMISFPLIVVLLILIYQRGKMA